MTARIKVYHRTSVGHRFGAMYHKQDDFDDCGRACAQALLRTIEGKLYQQSKLEEDVGAHCIETLSDSHAQLWGAYPSCMEERLNSAAKLRSREMKLLAFNSPADASQCIARSIALDGIPAAAVINNGGHWILVYGCDFDNHPDKPNEVDGIDEFVSCLQTPYKIRAFYVHDPAATPWSMNSDPIANIAAPPGEHSDDDKCGRGIVRCTDENDQPISDEAGKPLYENRGLAYRRIKYGYWREMVFSSIPSTPLVPNDWEYRHLAVVDVTDIPNVTTAFSSCEVHDEPEDSVICSGDTLPVWATDRTKFDNDKALAERIRNVAWEGLQDDGLVPITSNVYRVNNTSSSWKKAWRSLLTNTKPGRVFPVAPENTAGSTDEMAGFYYYLVELTKVRSNNEIVVPAVVLVSGCRNKEKVLEIAAVAEGGTTAIQFDSSEDQIAAVRAMKVKPALNVKLEAVPGVTISEPVETSLVWQPRPGHLSPYAPSRRISVEYKPAPDAEPNRIQILLPATVSQWQQHLRNLDLAQLQLPIDKLVAMAKDVVEEQSKQD